MLIGWVLVILGTVILFQQLNIFSFNRAASLALSSLFLGAVLFIRGLSHPLHRGILSGSFFIFTGLAIAAMYFQLFILNDAIAVILISLGLAYLVYFVFVRAPITHLIVGVAMVAFGGFLLVYSYGFISYWDLKTIVHQFWPVFIILLGLGIFIDGLISKWKIKNQETILTIRK